METLPWFRKSRASNQSSRTGGRLPHGSWEADRHSQVDEGLTLAADHRRLQAISNLQLHALPDRALEPIQEVGGIERGREVLALVLGLHRFDGAAQVGRRGRESDPERVELELHRRALTREQADPADGIHELRPRYRQ